eukprot:TRINITY_DN6207_c0_g1_i2.p1 TRINITY_DN6207_c0_g1~~TRINITY_DN6207_c0_g1_i2.p1  ORF type:complete len:179 (-),score=48.67 TRINITY_DN6207_c0_g1_i2:139-675(-)
MGVAKRKRTRTKVRRKIKNPRNVFVKDINMRETWDSKRTVQQNYAALNLAFAKRASDKRKLEEEREAKIEAGEAPIDESATYQVPEEKIDETRKWYMNQGEQDLAFNMITKHGDNYVKMFRDKKLNVMQHTKKQLQNLCERYVNYLEEIKAEHERRQAEEESGGASVSDEEESSEESS